jgi:hypothetical protein
LRAFIDKEIAAKATGLIENSKPLRVRKKRGNSIERVYKGDVIVAGG